MSVSSTILYSDLFGACRLDAEFYQPKYVQNETIISRFPSTVKLGDITTKFFKGIFDIKAEEYVAEGVPFVRISNLKDGVIDENGIAFITSERHEIEKKTSLKKYDLILSKTACPAASLVQIEECNTSQDTIAVRTKCSNDFNAYLAVYLNTRYGLLQMERLFQGNIQMHLSLSDSRTITIPVPSKEFQSEISRLVEDSIQKRRESKAFYAEAESILLRELGLDSLDHSPQIAHIANFSEAIEASRLDAEYFQPQFWEIIDAIRNQGPWYHLDDLVTYCSRGVQPKYVENGSINVVNTKHMTSTLLSDDLEKTDKEFWDNNKNAQLQKNDVLLYSTGAYIGRTNFYPSNEKGIGSNHVTIIRVDPKKCNPLYISAYLNSIPGLYQTDQRAHGSAQREIYPADIGMFIIGLPKREIQDHIAQKIQQSLETRQTAETFLEEAKNRLERMILAGI